MEVMPAIAADEIPPELIDLVPITFARQHLVLPVGERGDVVRIAVADPLDPSPLDDLRALLGRPVEPVAVPGDAIDRHTAATREPHG